DEGRHTIPLSLSPANLLRLYKKWKRDGENYLLFIPNYKPGKPKMPRELIAEFHRRMTKPGLEADSVAIKSILDDWFAGKEISGLGTWQEYWSRTQSGLPLPGKAPDFPFNPRTFYQHKPKRSVKTR